MAWFTRLDETERVVSGGENSQSHCGEQLWVPMI